MSAEEREALSLGLAQGQSQRTMARVLGRAQRTRDAVSGLHGAASGGGPGASARRPRTLLEPWRWPYVQTSLGHGCSPEQIAGRLRRAYPDDMRTHRSTETIYAALDGWPRGALRQDLSAGGTPASAQGAPLSHAGTDRTRPHSNHDVHYRAPCRGGQSHRPGHWDGDLRKGARHGSAVGTLVERTTRRIILVRMEGPDAASAYQGFTKKLRHVPALLRNTLTDDRGKEMTEHERLAIRVFFADPYSPWQRGTKENTNSLVRQYLPKGTDLSGYTQHELNAIKRSFRTNPISIARE